MHDDSLPALPPLNAATLLRALFQRPAHGAQAAIPDTRYRLDRIDAGAVARYREALGFEGERVPLTYYYPLAQRAHLASMLGRALPFRLAGIIHVDNALEAQGRPLPERPLLLATSLTLTPPSPHGAVHAVLHTQASQDGAPLFSCRSTYLVVRGSGHAPRARAAEPAPAPALAPLAQWQLEPDSGRAYARVSGDWNPIHLTPWSARLMGLKQPIIHGMHTMGRACAELERAGGRRVVALGGRFRAPLPLGSRALLAADLDQGRYTVNMAGKIVVEGSFRFA